jgi:tRNA U34 5-methylaminomethyl-2-thiouridine-forming methyltransferase MnmC
LAGFLARFLARFLAGFLAGFSPTMEPHSMDISSFWTHRDWTRETHF